MKKRELGGNFMNKAKATGAILAAAVMISAMAAGCGSAAPFDVSSISYEEDADVSFWDVADGLRGKESAGAQDSQGLDFDNFIGYDAYSGNDSEFDEYVVVNEDGELKVYHMYSLGGDQEIYVGTIDDNDAFIATLTSLEYKKVEWAESDGDIENYGFIYFQRDGEIYSFATENIFSVEE